jgi:hypothetical protein
LGSQRGGALAVSPTLAQDDPFCAQTGRISHLSPTRLVATRSIAPLVLLVIVTAMSLQSVGYVTLVAVAPVGVALVSDLIFRRSGPIVQRFSGRPKIDGRSNMSLEH